MTQENIDFYKLSEKDFIKDEYDELIAVYNGYRIEISYCEEYQYWCVDAFDLKEEQYVFYPCLRIFDKDKTRFNEVIQRTSKYIEKKIKSLCEESNDILIYIDDIEDRLSNEIFMEKISSEYDWECEEEIFVPEEECSKSFIDPKIL